MLGGLPVGTPASRRDSCIIRRRRMSIVPQYCNPVLDLVEDESQDITIVDRPRVIVNGRRGGGWGMEVVAHIVGVRMPIPPAFPGVLRMNLSIVNFEVVVGVPADSQGCLIDRRWVG